MSAIGIELGSHTVARIFCIGLDKVTAVTDVLQHERKDLLPLWNTLNSVEMLLLVCEVKCIVHSDDQGSNIVITLKLF